MIDLDIRYVGYIMGVKEELLPKTYVEMIDLAYAINKHQCKPNDISTALVRLLFEGINFSPYYFFLPGVFWSELSRFVSPSSFTYYHNNYF